MVTNRMATLAVLLAAAFPALPQGRPTDWPSLGGDARRTGWERSDLRITKAKAKDIQLVLKRKFEGPRAGATALTPPVVIGLLISYKGFKELGFVAGNSGDLWAIDLDLNKLFWRQTVPVAAKEGACGAAATFPALTPPAVFGRRPAGSAPQLPARLGGGGFGGARPVWTISGDGNLRQINTSNGSDQFPPLPFLPANSKPRSVLMTDNTIYTATTAACSGSPNAIWAMDLLSEQPKTSSFSLNGATPGGLGAFAAGNDGSIYLQTSPGEFDAAAGKWGGSLLALTAKTLTMKGYYAGPAANAGPEMNVATPVVFEYQGRDLIVVAGRDGRLRVLDSKSASGGAMTPLSETAPVASAAGGIWGGLSSWEDSDGVRWVAAPVWGATHADLKAPGTNGAAPNGSVVAFRLEDRNGKPVLEPAWVSRDLESPVPPVVTEGVVFALSTGGYTRQGAEMKPAKGAKAVLYGLDAATGKELYSSGGQVTAPGSLTGLSVANGRVFFTTADNTLYGFGIFLEI